ncbi:MAG: hypothetical protein ACWGNV_10155 [Bacteroidales bacterium]
MPYKIVLPALASMIIGVSITTSFAQGQSNQRQGYIIWEDVVYPSRVTDYEQTIREQMALYARAGFPFRADVYQTNEFVYYWVFEIDHYADIDSLHQEFNRIYMEESEQVEALNAGYIGTQESTHSWTCYSDPELSYKPRGLQQPDSEKPYMHMGLCYPKTGTMKQARDIMKGFVALATETEAVLGWDTYTGDMGVEIPMLFWVSFTKDPQDFFNLNAADFNRMGSRADDLWEQMLEVTRKYEEKTGWYREDLSYHPE